MISPIQDILVTPYDLGHKACDSNPWCYYSKSSWFFSLQGFFHVNMCSYCFLYGFNSNSNVYVFAPSWILKSNTQQPVNTLKLHS